MKAIELLPVGEVNGGVLEELRAGLASVLQVPCRILEERLDPNFAYHAERKQFHSSQILARMRGAARAGVPRLGVAGIDLYIPILTFVFGEAEIGGACAVVSFHRLRQEFYGLPEAPEIARDRLLKEAVHEVGHTIELAHCDDYRCAMAPSHSVEWIDLKEAAFCDECRSNAARASGASRVRAGRPR